VLHIEQFFACEYNTRQLTFDCCELKLLEMTSKSNV